MKCPQEVVELMHKYLDEEATVQEEGQLRQHLQECKDCHQHFQELKKTIAMVQSTTHIEVPLGFTSGVMQRLPKEKRVVGYRRWFKTHPLMTAVALFAFLMVGSLVSTWDNGDQLSVSKQPKLQVEDHTVTVPKGEIIEGDVIVRNGDIKIEGEVRGDVVVINGDKYMASAGNVTGDRKSVV